MRSVPVIWLARIVITLSVPLMVIVSPLYVLFSSGYVHLQYASPTFPPSIRFDRAERSRISDAIMRYMRDDAQLEAMANTRTGEGEIALLPSETQHLVDVRVVVRTFFQAHAIALVLALAAALFLARVQPGLLSQGLRQGIGITVGLLLVVGVAALLDFDLFFTLFHGVFFEAGTWTFFYEDTLIQLYPIEFWMRAVFHLLLLMAALAAALLGVATAVERSIRRRLDA
jgi:integral membrane protein (TIGR01906 family)